MTTKVPSPPQSHDLETLTAWHDYEARNRRANVDYRLRPSIVPLISASLERHGLGVTSSRFRLPPPLLVSWFPELFEPAGEAS